MRTKKSGYRPARLKSCLPQLSLFTTQSNSISNDTGKSTNTTESEASPLEKPLRKVLHCSMNFPPSRTRSCRYFSKGCCRLGDYCNFLHNAPTTALHTNFGEGEAGRGVVWDRRPDEPSTQFSDIPYGPFNWSESYFTYSLPPYDFHPLRSGSLLPQLSPVSLLSELDNTCDSLYSFNDPSSTFSRSSTSSVVSDTVIENSILRGLGETESPTATPESFSRVPTAPASHTLARSESLPDYDYPSQLNRNSDTSGGQSTSAHLLRIRSLTDPPAGPPPCKFFWKDRCKKGNLCRFSHDEGSLGSSGDASTSRPRSASDSSFSRTSRGRNMRSSDDSSSRTVQLVLPDLPSIPKEDSSPVKTEGEKWRVIGGGVMLGKNPASQSPTDSQRRRPASRRVRKRLQTPLTNSAGEHRTTHMNSPDQSQPNLRLVRSPLPVEPIELPLIEEEEPVVVANSKCTSHEDVPATLRPSAFPLPDEICRPKTTPPSLKPSSAQLPLFVHSES